MHPAASQLARCLEQIRQGGEWTLKNPPKLQTSLTPWTLWLLMALVRQVERQRWVSSVIITKLGVDMDAMSDAGALAHPSVPQWGLVPGHTDWEYYFHGRGCCLSNRITGESIDVNFYEGISDWIDDFFFLDFLESLKNPEPIEQRLLELYPTTETIILGIDQLHEEGLLQRRPDSKVFQPLDDFQDLADDIEELNRLLDSESGQLIAARLLDDPLLQVGSSHPQRNVAACIAAQRRHLESRFAEPKSERLALIALCDLVPDATEYLLRAFTKPPSETTSAALDIVSRRPDEDWSKSVYELMCRTDPSGDLPQPYTWTTCVDYLLKRDSHVHEIRAQILQVGRRSLGDAAILGLEHFSDLAVELFRRALRSDVPMDRITAAAALAILDQPWCHNLLLELLQESGDQELTAESRAALMASRHHPLHDAVARWEQAHPHEPEPGPYLTVTEMSLRNRDERIQHEMNQLHERVIRLRTVNPPESSREQCP